MVGGNREESVIEQIRRHIEEMENDKISWEAELKYAERKNDEKYKEYCKIMVRITQNTLGMLKDAYKKFE